jgi:hypothetical protein
MSKGSTMFKFVIVARLKLIVTKNKKKVKMVFKISLNIFINTHALWKEIVKQLGHVNIIIV